MVLRLSRDRPGGPGSTVARPSTKGQWRSGTPPGITNVVKYPRDMMRCVMKRAGTGYRRYTVPTRAVIAAVVLGLAVSIPCHAQPPADPKSVPRVFGEELTAINACVREVRAMERGSKFDAHLTPRGSMRYAGTEPEIAAFKRCMQAKGFPTEPN